MNELSDKEIAKILNGFIPGSSSSVSSLVEAFRKSLDSAARNTESKPPAALPLGGGAPPQAPPPPPGGNGHAAAPQPQPPPEPGGDMSIDEIFLRLDDLTLPKPILVQAAQAFAKARYVISLKTAKAKSDSKILRPFTQAERADGVKLALINVPRQVYDKSRVWGSLRDGIDEIDGYVRFVSDSANKVTPGFAGFLGSAVARGKKWEFTPWDWVHDFLNGNETAESVFRLPEAEQAPSQLTLNDLPESGRKLIKTLLSDRAGEHGQAKPGQIIRNLVDDAGWSKELSKKVAGWGDDPESLALNVCEEAIRMEGFEPPGHARYGDTHLGALLQALLPKAGLADRKQIGSIIFRYNLVTRLDSVAEVKKLTGA